MKKAGVRFILRHPKQLGESAVEKWSLGPTFP